MSDTATDATAINQVSKANGNNAGSNNPYFKETVTPINQKVAGGGYKTSDDRYVGGMYGTPTVTQAPILNSNVTSGTPEQRSAQMEAGEKLYNTGNYSPDEINYLIKVNAEGGTLPSNLGLQEFHNAQVQYLKTNPTLEYKQQIPQTTKSIMFTDYGRGGTQIQKGEATILNALGYGKYASYNPSYKPSTDIVSKGRTYLEEHIPLFPKSPADVLLTATLPFGIAQSSFTSVKLFASGSAMFLGIKEAYDPEATLKQRIEGGIISTLGAIGFAGEAIPKTRGFIQTFGRTEKLPEELVTKEVLGGKSTFPDLPRNQQLKAFEVGTYSLEPNIKGGYHSTASGYFLESEFKSNTGSSELSGMYIAPSVSQHFLGISPVSENPSLFSSKLGDILGNPKIAFIEPRSFKINPYDLSPEQQFVGQRSVNGKYAFFSEPTEKGIAYLPLMKTEAESVIIEGTSFKRTGQDYYVKLRGQRIAIEQYKALGENDLKLGSTKSKSIFSTNEIKSYSKDLISYSKSKGILSETEISAGISSNKLFNMKGFSQEFKGESNTIYKPSSKDYYKSPPVSLMYSYNSGGSSIQKIFNNSSSITGSSKTGNPLMPPSPPSRRGDYGGNPLLNEYGKSLRGSPSLTPPITKKDFIFDFFTSVGKKKKNKSKRKGKEFVAYAPSFSAQVLGISKTISRKNLYKEATKFKGGLDYRPIFKIK